MKGTTGLSQKEIALFFFPLLLNVQLMSISHSVINAALARLPDFVTALASFSVAMILHLFLASPSYQNHTITIAMVRGKRSLRGTILFVLIVAVYVSTLLALIAFTPLGDFVLRKLLGVTADVAESARSVLGILVFLPFFTGFRGLFQGLVIQARRTLLVSFATGVRVCALLILLAVGSRWYQGPELGAVALLGCIIVETALMGAFAWRVHLPATGEAEKSLWEIIRYGFPLAYSSCLQQTIPLLINAIISRLPDGKLALAAFGIIRGFLFLLAGPMRNLQQAHLTLVKRASDSEALLFFFKWVAMVMALLILLVAFPFNGPVLGTIMGIEESLRSYIALPLAFCTIFPFLYGASNLLRGYFAGIHRTSQLGRSTVYKVLFIFLGWGVVLLLPPRTPGIAIGIFLLICAEFVEFFYLRRQRHKHMDTLSCCE